MIRFTCEICGLEIMATDKEAGLEKKCDNCFAVHVVPEPTYIKVRKRVRSKAQQQSHTPSRAESEADKKPAEKQLREDIYEDMEEETGFFEIMFDETTLFSMTFIFFLLFILNRDMRRELLTFIRDLCGESGLAATMSIVFLFLPFTFGMFLSVFHGLSKRRKSSFEKALMYFFAVVISAGTGIYLGWYILRGPGSFWLIIFGLWNLAYSGLLIYQFESIVIGESTFEGMYVSDLNATIGQIILSSIAAIIILLCCEYWIQFEWVISYSICITYTTSLDRQVQKLLVRR